MRSFIQSILRDMTGNALLMLATGKTPPTEKSPNGKLRVNDQHWFAYPEELDDMVAFAARAYAAKRDAYISPVIYGSAPFIKDGRVVDHDRNGRPMYARSKENAIFAQTVYMDSDACPPGAFRLTPSLHVDTSEGHGHDYWFLSEPVPASIVSEVAHRITTAHKAEGSDPSGWSANKVLRLPTFNTAYDEANPYEIKWEDSSQVYYVEDISGIYEDVVVDSVPDADPDRVLPPVPTIEGLPDTEPLLGRIPATERNLNDLIYKKPKTGDGGWQSEQRYALLLELKRFGFTDEETIAIAWAAPAASKWREDSRGVQGLWWELQAKVIPILDMERGTSIPLAPAPAPKKDALKLLTSAERSRFESRMDLSTLYVNWARSKVKVFNGPHHHSSYWVATSVLLGAAGEFPKDPRPMPLNLYVMDLGESSTGKSEAKGMSDDIIQLGAPGAQVGVRHSKENLIEVLAKRENQTTYLDDDEADGFLAEVKSGQGYLSGIRQIFTKIYDGFAPMIGKVGRDDLLKAGRHVIATMRLMGTMVGMMKTLDRDMFYEGFLARQIWVIGDDIPTTQETVKTKLASDHVAYEAMPKWWASHYKSLQNRARSRAPMDRQRASITPTDEAVTRADKAFWEISQYFEKQYDRGMWNAITRRMSDIIWKVASLQAMSSGRVIISTRDVEVALGYAEIWLGNAITIADNISDTHFSKQADDIEKFIAARSGKEADVGAIYRFRKGDDIYNTDKYLKSLVMQSRIYINRENHYKIKETK